MHSTVSLLENSTSNKATKQFTSQTYNEQKNESKITHIIFSKDRELLLTVSENKESEALPAQINTNPSQEASPFGVLSILKFWDRSTSSPPICNFSLNSTLYQRNKASGIKKIITLQDKSDLNLLDDSISLDLNPVAVFCSFSEGSEFIIWSYTQITKDKNHFNKSTESETINNHKMERSEKDSKCEFNYLKNWSGQKYSSYKQMRIIDCACVIYQGNKSLAFLCCQNFVSFYQIQSYCCFTTIIHFAPELINPLPIIDPLQCISNFQFSSNFKNMVFQTQSFVSSLFLCVKLICLPVGSCMGGGK